MINDVLEYIEKKLIVSCQALEHEPLYSPEALLAMARAVIEGGASALRANSPLSIRQMKQFFNIPIIGLYKKDYEDSDIYITPTKLEARAVIFAGADIVAIDATNRKRPLGENLKDLVDFVHEHNKLAMADISIYEEGLNAEEIGFDLVGTTMSGYTPYSKKSDEPDFELLSKLTENLKIPVIMEGKIWNPEHIKEAFERNAFSVVVGSAITRPQLITQKFAQMIPTSI